MFASADKASPSEIRLGRPLATNTQVMRSSPMPLPMLPHIAANAGETVLLLLSCSELIMLARELLTLTRKLDVGFASLPALRCGVGIPNYSEIAGRSPALGMQRFPDFREMPFASAGCPACKKIL